MKTSVSKYTAKDLDETELGESHLWKDDDNGELSVSICDPWDGYRSSKDVLALAKKLQAWGERMKRRGQ